MTDNTLLPLESISVVICTRNRADSIGQAVTSVLANDDPSFDLTIVDQSTSDATRLALEPLLADPGVHYVHVSQPGLSRAYNTGIRSSTGPLLAFTDDDCVVPRTWLGAIREAFTEESAADLLYGQVLPPRETNAESGTIVPVLYIPRAERLSKRDGFKVFGMGANFAARRRLFTKIGGFDELLGGGAPLISSQDYDLAYRAYRSGSVILLRPEVTVTHYGERTPEQWPSTERAYGIGDGAFYLKHVRCGDLFAGWLLFRQLADRGGRMVVKRLRRLAPAHTTYLRFVFVGMRESWKFGVDRRTRVYVPR